MPKLPFDNRTPQLPSPSDRPRSYHDGSQEHCLGKHPGVNASGQRALFRYGLIRRRSCRKDDPQDRRNTYSGSSESAATSVTANRTERTRGDSTARTSPPGSTALLDRRIVHGFLDALPQLQVRQRSARVLGGGLIGEPIWPGRSATEYPACAQHEALINAAFTGRDVTIVCPYDVAGLEASVLADARQTHPLLWEGEQRYPSADYAPDDVVARYNEPFQHTGDAEVHLVATAADLSPARRRIADRARTLGLPAARIPDLELIATELAANSLQHAGAPCELRLWRENGEVVCEARDTGQLTDPLAGRRPAEGFSGRGLLLINDLADLVRTHTSAQGTTIRAYLRP
ncbi:anti-sigma factor RsbA family regulatory protein [Amycolatopsis magusensis]|nr:anti-sigma factor RsbA family regulatory protein [Amycolatopsis magusensis]